MEHGRQAQASLGRADFLGGQAVFLRPVVVDFSGHGPHPAHMAGRLARVAQRGRPEHAQNQVIGQARPFQGIACQHHQAAHIAYRVGREGLDPAVFYAVDQLQDAENPVLHVRKGHGEHGNRAVARGKVKGVPLKA